MDTRNGNLYHDEDAARRAGVPPQHLRQVQVITYSKGPFKGRRYELHADGTRGRRLKPDATKEEIAIGLERQEQR